MTHTLDDRPVHAADGDLSTAWTVADFAEARGEFLRFAFTEPQTIASLHAVQPLVEANRHITEIMIVADGGDQRRTLPLSSASWTTEGEELTFAPITGTVFDVILTDLDYPVSDTYPVGISPVGFAELTLGKSPPTEEWIRTPRALVDRLGEELDAHDLARVRETLAATGNICRWLADIPVDLALLHAVGRRVGDFTSLAAQIDRAIDERGKHLTTIIRDL